MLTLLAYLLLAATPSATVLIDGKTCPLQSASYPPLVLYACGTVYVSPTPGLADYSAGAVLKVPGVVKVDRVFSDGFNASVSVPHARAPPALATAPVGAATHGDGP